MPKKPTLMETIAEQRATIAYLNNNRASLIKSNEGLQEEITRIRTALSAACKDVIAKNSELKIANKNAKESIETLEESRDMHYDTSQNYIRKFRRADEKLYWVSLAAMLLSVPYVALAVIKLIAFLSNHFTLIIK